MTPGLLLLFALIGYLAASVFYGAYLTQSVVTTSGYLIWAGRVSGILGVLLHAGAIGEHCALTRHTPLTSPAETLSATGWAIALAFLATEAVWWRKPPLAIGAFAYPLAFLCVFGGSVLGLLPTSPRHTVLLLDSNLVSLHVIAILFAFGLLALSVCCAVVYLIVHRLLKRKQFIGGIYSKLPSLTTVDNLAFVLVSLAFPMLTIGIIAGIIRALSIPQQGGRWLSDAHTLASIVSWAVYGIYLFSRTAGSWRGIKANYLLLAGMAATLLTYLAPSTLHRFS